MAELKVTIPNDKLQDVIDAFCFNYKYQDIIDELPNPQTKAQFAKAKLIEFVKDNFKAYKANQASEIARQTALDTAKQINIT